MITFIFVLLTMPVFAASQMEPNLGFKKIAVFPIQSDINYGPVLEKAWIAARASLTKNQIYYVATKAFMKEKDAFQPRGDLSVLDVVTVSRLLDAEAVITFSLAGRDFTLRLFDGNTGQIFWRYTYRFSTFTPIENQLESVTAQLTADLHASIPYHGLVRANLDKRVMVQNQSKLTVSGVLFSGETAAVGDPVQFVRLNRISMEPLFQNGGQSVVIAEGFVSQIDGDNVTVQLTQVSEKQTLLGSDLIRLPKEAERRERSLNLISQKSNRGTEFVATELKLIERETDEQKAAKGLVITGSFITSIVGFLLLAL